MVWAVVYLCGFGLGGRTEWLLPGVRGDQGSIWSAWTARTAAVLPAALAVTPPGASVAIWLGVFSGGLAAGILEAGPRKARRSEMASSPHTVAKKLSWRGPAIFRVTGWATRATDDRWRAPTRILDLGSGTANLNLTDPAPGQGVLLSGTGEPPRPGSLLTGSVELTPPRVAPVPGGFDYRLFLAGRGLLWRGDLLASKVVREDDLLARLGTSLLSPVRTSLTDRLACLFPPVEASLAGAVLLGIRNDETRRTSRPFFDLGLAHLFAVSGLHVGILLGIVLLPGQIAGLSPWQRAGPVSILLPIYVLLTGMPGSVVRAASLGFLALLGAALGRRVQPLRLLCLLFWSGTIWEPFQNLDTGLKLSYLAAGGILAVSSLTNGLRFTHRRVLGMMGTGLAVSLSAQWFTLPLVAGAFGRVSLVSPLANLVAVPLFGLAVWCVVLSLVLADVWPLAAAATASWGWVVFRGLSGSAGYLATLSNGFPLGLPPPGIGQILVWALLTGLGLGALKQQRLGRLSGRAAVGVVSLTVLAGLLVLGPAGWDLGSANHLVAWQFDVGQGDCGLLVFPDGWTLMIDTAGRYGFGGADPDGPLTRNVLPFLQRHGCRKIDAVVLTHGHLDHTGGAASLAATLPVDKWFVAGGSKRFLAGLVDSARVIRPTAPVVLHRWQEWETAIIYPPDHLPADVAENDHSLVVVLRRSGRDVAAWSGDLEQRGERILLESGLAPNEVMLWKAGHHGSNTSGSRKFLERLDPEWILVSCGVGNRYGHPSHGPYVVGCDTANILRTDLQGTVQLVWDRQGRLKCRPLRALDERIGLP